MNAGAGVGGPFLETSLERELGIIALNCAHTVHLAKRVLNDMVRVGKGRVLITGSVASTAPAPFQAVYGATKAFVYSFAHAIRDELKDTGVTVTVMQPSAADPEFFERAGMQDTKAATDDKDTPAQVAKDGFDAMMAGKASVLAGSLGSKVLAEPLKAKQFAKEAKPGSGKR